MPVAVAQTAPASSFFTSVPVPGLADSPDTYVDMESQHLRALGLYHISGTAPTAQHSFIVSANSRNTAVNSYNGRLWVRAWDQGYTRWAWEHMIGVCFAPADLTGQTKFGFNHPSGNWSSGSAIGSTRSTSGYEDLSHFGFGSFDSVDGPGGGIFMDGASQSYTAYVMSMTEANLPSKMEDMFGTGGEYADGGALTGDSLLLSSKEAYFHIYYLRGPGLGSFTYEHVTESVSNNTGDRDAADPSGSVSCSTTVVETHTVTGSDSYSTQTFTFDTAPAGWDDVTVGMAVAVHESDGTFRGMSIIEAKGSSSFDARWDFGDNPATGDVMSFGSVEIGVETYTMPTTSEDFRGPRFSNTSGVTVIIGYGTLVADGSFGFSIGGIGWSGNGYQKHLDEWPRESWGGELYALVGADAAILHQAEQSSTTNAMVNLYPAQIVDKSPNTEIYLAGDPQHDVGASGSATYSDAIIAQSLYGGGVVHESQFVGDHWAAWEMGHKDNEPHPSMIGHAETVRPHLNIFANLSPAATGVETITRDASLVFDLKVASGAEVDDNFKGEGTILVSYNTSFGGVAKRMILRFNRPRKLRPGATVVSASLTLNFSSGAGVDDADLLFVPLLDGKVTEDATWNDYDGTEAWDTAGGDYENVSEGSLISPALNGTGDAIYNIRRVVEKAIALNPKSDYIDILVRLDDEASNESVTINAYADNGNPPDAEAPSLSLVFHPADRIVNSAPAVNIGSIYSSKRPKRSPSRRSL